MKHIHTFDGFINEGTTYTIEDFNDGDIVHFRDNEAWEVVNSSGKGLFNRRRSADEITIKPFNKLAKDKNVSLAIEVDLNYLNKEVTKIEKK